jgi:hypothetical protein
VVDLGTRRALEVEAHRLQFLGFADGLSTTKVAEGELIEKISLILLQSSVTGVNEK